MSGAVGEDAEAAPTGSGGLRSSGLRAVTHRASSRLAGHGPQVRGSFWLIATVLTNALGGFVFWLVAARLYDDDPFGEAAALFTVVLFVNYVTNLGLPVVVARFANDRSDESLRLFNRALAATGVSSVVGSLVVLVLLPGDVVEPLRTWGGITGGVLFVAIVIGMAFTILCEVRLMALRRWGWVLGRAVVVSVVRLPLLWSNPLESDALWLFLLVAGIPALSGLAYAFALGRSGSRWPLRPRPERMGQALAYARVNYVGLLFLQAPQFALPVIVLVNVSASTMASFYVAFSIAAVVFLVPHALGQVLLVEGGREARDPRAQARVGLVLGLGLTTFATVAAFALADLVPVLYGSDFELAADALPWFVAASVPWSVQNIRLNAARLAQDRGAILAITATFALATLVPALLLVPDHEVAGAAVAWLFGNTAAALAAVAVSGRSARPGPIRV